jgi:hypothetical protein
MAKNQQLPLNPDEISGVCGRLLCCLSYENVHYKEQNKKMPKLGAEVVTPQGTGRVRHIHPLKETVTVILENMVLSEFAVSELISSKSGGASCGRCGGCTVKRRAGADEDNEEMRQTKPETESTSKPSPSRQGRKKSRNQRRRRKPRRRRQSDN